MAVEVSRMTVKDLRSLIAWQAEELNELGAQVKAQQPVIEAADIWSHDGPVEAWETHPLTHREAMALHDAVKNWRIYQKGGGDGD